MKITMPNGFIFEGTQAEYETFLAFAEAQQAINEADVETEYVPQEGDIVVVVSLDTFESTGTTVKVGDTGKVGVEGDNGKSVQVLVPGGKSAAVYVNKKEVRKATTIEVEAYEKALHKASFSVGDYVKVVNSVNGHNGKIAKILEVGTYHTPKGTGDFVIEFIPSVAGNFTIKAEKIVKATEAEVADASKPKLKAGDFVKFTKTGEYDDTDITLGKPYLIYEDSFGDLAFDDDVEDKRENPLAYTDCYEILSAEEVEAHKEAEKWSKLGRKVGEFRKGDIVVADRLSLPKDDINGHLGIIEDIGQNMVGIRFTNGRYCGAYTADNNVKLIAPVESTLI